MSNVNFVILHLKPQSMNVSAEVWLIVNNRNSPREGDAKTFKR